LVHISLINFKPSAISLQRRKKRLRGWEMRLHGLKISIKTKHI